MITIPLVREECTDNTTVTPVTDLDNDFSSGTENYTGINSTLSASTGALVISKTSGNVTFGAERTFTITQNGSNHALTFNLTQMATNGVNVLCQIDGNTVATLTTTGISNLSLSPLSTGNHTIKFVTAGNVSGSNRSFTIDDVEITYGVSTVTTTCTEMLSIADYRYSFNGKEKDNEVSGSGNQYDYGFRIYNPRLGRFLSIDPLTKDYPMLTPYQYASNRPIDGIDIDGLEWMEAQLFTAVTVWYAKLKGGTAKIVQAATNSSSYNHETVPKSTQNKLRLIEAGQGATAVKESIVEAGEFAAETINTIPGVDVIGDPLLALYYGNKGDYESASAYLVAATTPFISGAVAKPVVKELTYVLKKNDIDLRGAGVKFRDALEAAFEKTGVAKDKFTPTKFAKTREGKTIPVEFRAEGGAEVSIDFGHKNNGPDAPHIGWQTPGKRKSGGAERGHIILDDVPAGR